MSDLYDLIVIGGGAAGLTAANYIGGVEGKVALIEREHLGGDCTWVGCVPSKALIKVAKVAHAMRTADHFGIRAVEPEIDMRAVRDHIQAVVAEVYAAETPAEIAKRGVEVIEGHGRFLDAHTVAVDGRQMRAKKFVIATGAGPAVPPIPGLDQVPYHTNRTFFENDRLPAHLIVLGAGPIGMEMAQAYRRLGAQVTVIGLEVMPRDEPEAVETILRVFSREGVRVIQGEVSAFSQSGGTIIARLKDGQAVEGDMLLVAVGRAPTVADLGLEQAGVAFSKQGIQVDDKLRTSVSHIYAVGDCTTGPKLTHYGGYQGAIAGRNVLIPFPKANGHPQVYPWVTFTEPEIAQVGLREAEARQQHGDAVKSYTLPMTEGDRSVAEAETDGFIKIVYKGSGELLGASIVAARAGEMITEFTAALHKGGLRGLSATIHAYPTYSDIVKKAATKVILKELLGGGTGRLVRQVAKRLL